jgi:hypothetical protein
MNDLTTPPRVEDLTPERHEEMRSGLVALAHRQIADPTQGPRWRQLGIAVTAATAIAAVIAGSALIGRLDDDRSHPAGQGATSTATATSTPKPPAAGVVNLDLGPASDADAQRMVSECMKTADRQPIGPDDAMNITWARWITTPVTKSDGVWRDKPARQLVAVITSADGQKQGWCRDGFLTSAGATDTAPSGMLTGSTSGSGGEQPGHPWVLTKTFSLSAFPGVARVELRLRWPGGAGPWYSGYVDQASLTGYVEAAAVGQRGAPPLNMRVDVRAFDAAGNIVHTSSAPKDDPIGFG